MTTETPAAESTEATDRNELVMQELPQVYYIAARILERLPHHVDLEDLVSAGVIGLLEACRSYDLGKNAQFKTFAKFRIRGAILDSLREMDWGSRGLRRKGREITDARTRLETELGHEPSMDDIAREMQVTSGQLDETMSQLDGLHIVCQRAVSPDGEDVYDIIEMAPSHWENPFDICCREEDKAKLAAAVAELSDREQLILSLYYREELTMKEVATVVGIALSRVSQIHQVALGKLKNTLGTPLRQQLIARSKPMETGAGIPGKDVARNAARESARSARHAATNDGGSIQ